MAIPFKINTFSPTPYRGCNLKNVGVTCYLNVVLQCLTHTVPLVNALINFGDCKLCSHQVTSSYSTDNTNEQKDDEKKNEEEKEEEKMEEEEKEEENMEEEQEKNNGETLIDKEKETICWLCNVRDHINMAIYFNGMSFTPGFFIRNLTDISSLFAEDEQQDAHEYLLGLLTRLHECCLGLPASPNTSLEDESLITNIFCGRLKSQITCCECGHKSETFEPVLNLSLEIDGHDNLISALQSFTRVEKIDDPENLISCDGCKTKVVVEKQLTIDKAPEVLVIQLKRFTCDGSTIVKNEQYVQYPETLNLAPFIDEFREQEQELDYRLYAVVNHHGLPWNGHYMCFIHSHGQRWFLKNDLREYKCNTDFVMDQTAYILFYVKTTSSMSMSFHSFITMSVERNRQTNNSEEMPVPEQQQSNNNEGSSSSTLQDQ